MVSSPKDVMVFLLREDKTPLDYTNADILELHHCICYCHFKFMMCGACNLGSSSLLDKYFTHSLTRSLVLYTPFPTCSRSESISCVFCSLFEDISPF